MPKQKTSPRVRKLLREWKRDTSTSFMRSARETKQHASWLVSEAFKSLAELEALAQREACIPSSVRINAGKLKVKIHELQTGIFS